MELIQELINGNIDIVGDVHGEIKALENLLNHLGYDIDGNHKDGRKIVFVGDLCDRGPNSIGVIKIVKNIIDKGNGQAVIGNHELNLLQKKAKDGSGWYFEERQHLDTEYEPYEKTKEEDKEFIYGFLESLPIALENDNLRVVHASWNNDAINVLKNHQGYKAMDLYKYFENLIHKEMHETGLLQSFKEEEEKYQHQIINEDIKDIPFLHNIAKYNIKNQMDNPIRVLTSGQEKITDKPFFTSGKWRFVHRDVWWDLYADNKPVIVGHYWRKLEGQNKGAKLFGENMFGDVGPTDWHGLNKNVFCVDYSVGARFKERLKNKEGEKSKLVALRFPEMTLMLENGQVLNTEKFNNTNHNKKNKL